MLVVTPIYAGILAVLFFWLSLRVSLLRMQGPARDDAAKERLHRAVRAQGNASEYIPFGLILLLVLEFQGAPGGLTHLFGVMLLVGRIGHFLSFRSSFIRPLTQVSMATTYSMFCFSGLAVLYFAFVA